MGGVQRNEGVEDTMSRRVDQKSMPWSSCRGVFSNQGGTHQMLASNT